jgi:hypothetical protein
MDWLSKSTMLGRVGTYWRAKCGEVLDALGGMEAVRSESLEPTL